MKLLFDQNLSHRLIDELAALYPESVHVRAVGLERTDDARVWSYAGAGGYTIVTKDADFQERSILLGFPPKVIWIRRGNCTTRVIADALRANHAAIGKFALDDAAGVLVLY